MKFNQGGFNPATSSYGAQINDKFWSKVPVMEARKKRVFSCQAFFWASGRFYIDL